MKKLFLAAFVLLLFNSMLVTVAQKPAKSETRLVTDPKKMSEEEKISYLISYIRNLDNGIIFIRNGKEYNPNEAADHLQMKYDKHKKKIKTAQDFVDGLGSKSSATGELYIIKLADGKTINCGDLLNKELERIES
jgi:hypothetical protein